MSAKPYSKHAMEKKTNGPQQLIQYFGQNESLCADAWAVLHILQLQAHTLSFHSISQKQTISYPPPDTVLSSTDLISRCAIALQKRRNQLAQLHDKVHSARLAAAKRFEKEHSATIQNYDFKLGDLVLIRNTAIEKALNRKMRARYLGPLIVLSRNKGGAYIIAELDGSVFDRPIAAFRVIPYFARKALDIPSLSDLIDISAARLTQMEDSYVADPDEDVDDDEDFLLDD
jgi:hypothetical protein